MKLNNNSALIGVFLLVLIQITPSYSQELVKDINTDPMGLTDYRSDLFCECGDYLYFGTRHQLWRTDGTEEGTVKVSGTLRNVFDYACLNNNLIFSARGELYGIELWMINASLQAPQLVRDIEEGYFSSVPDMFEVVNGKLLFFITPIAGPYLELWQSDGTSEGTSRVHQFTELDIFATDVSVTSSEDYLFFNLAESDAGITEIWRSDGTPENTIRIVAEPVFNFWRPMIAVEGNAFFFSRWDSEQSEGSLWYSDGTVAGTRKVSTHAFSSTPTNFLPFGDKIIFSAEDSTWISDGTEAGTFALSIGNTTAGIVYEGEFYGVSNFDYMFTWLFKTDGTLEGTSEDLFSFWDASTNRNQLVVLSDKFFLPVIGEETGDELGVYNTNDSTLQVVKDIFPGEPSSSVTGLTVWNNKVFFVADDGEQGDQLWFSDGTEEGTHVITVKSGTGHGVESDPVYHILNNKLFFQSYLNVSTLWKTDGTEEGTLPRYQFPGFSALLGTKDNKLLFFSDLGLTSIDGTEGAMQVIKNFSGQGFGVREARSYNIGDRFVFQLSMTFTYGTEFWVTDGTEAGTKILKDINPGSGNGPHRDHNIVLGDRVIFNADDGSSGAELWISDGTETGTVRLRDINPGMEGSSPQDFAVLNDIVLFGANDGKNGTELWKTDGSEAGTEMVVDLFPGGSSEARLMTTVRDWVLFVTDNATSGWTLWKTDGTASGTEKVTEFNGLYPPMAFVEIGDKLYFAAHDDEHGREIWVSDGTASGTFVIDVFKGPASPEFFSFIPAGEWLYFHTGFSLWRTNGKSPDAEFVAATLPIYSGIYHDGWIYYTANSDEYGNELFRIAVTDGNPDLEPEPQPEPEPIPEPEPEPITSAESSVSSQFRAYPNPVSDILSIQSHDLAGKNGTAEIIDFNGQLIDTFTLSNSGINNYSVMHYSAGIYLIKIRTGAETIYWRFVKN